MARTEWTSSRSWDKPLEEQGPSGAAARDRVEGGDDDGGTPPLDVTRPESGGLARLSRGSRQGLQQLQSDLKRHDYLNVTIFAQ